MNLVDMKDVKWVHDDAEKTKALTAHLPTAAEKSVTEQPISDGSLFGKMKSVIRKAVDCCIE